MAPRPCRTTPCFVVRTPSLWSPQASSGRCCSRPFLPPLFTCQVEKGQNPCNPYNPYITPLKLETRLGVNYLILVYGAVLRDPMPADQERASDADQIKLQGTSCSFRTTGLWSRCTRALSLLGTSIGNGFGRPHARRPEEPRAPINIKRSVISCSFNTTETSSRCTRVLHPRALRCSHISCPNCTDFFSSGRCFNLHISTLFPS